MVRDKEKLKNATQFRKRGFSYSEIAKICGVSKATLSIWFGKKRFSKKVKEENVARASKDNAKRISLLNKARNTERDKRYKEAIRSAQTEYAHYKATPLFVAGIMLYATIGDKKDPSVIRISSTESEQHKMFLRFATQYLGVSKNDVRFWLLLNNSHDTDQCLRIWSKELKISPKQFYKTQVVQGMGKKDTLHHGLLNTIIGNIVLKKKLMRWIELTLADLCKIKY